MCMLEAASTGSQPSNERFKSTYIRSCDSQRWVRSSVGTASDRPEVLVPGAARDFFPRKKFQCTHSYGVRTPPCAIARIYICVHVKDSVVHVRVRWIMETLKHPACTTGWVARLYRSWLSRGKAIRISHGRNPNGTKSYYKKVSVNSNRIVFRFKRKHKVLCPTGL